MEHEEHYTTLNGIITLENKSYKKVLMDGKVVKGDIIYNDSTIVLQDRKSDVLVELYTKDLQKDTIHFRTKKVNEKPIKGDIIIFSGKLIKVK